MTGSAAALDWNIVTVNDASAAPGGTAIFFFDGAFSLYSGCNRFNGTAALDGDNYLVTGPVASTRMACPGDELSRQDEALANLLQGRLQVSFDPFSGLMTLFNGTVRIGLIPVETTGPEILEPHGGRSEPTGQPPYLSPFGMAGKLELRSAPSAEAEATGAVDPGTVLRSEGCQQAGDVSWCNLELPDGSLTGWAPGQVLEPADSSLRAGQGIFDASGRVACAKGMGTPTSQCVFGVARDGGGNATVVVQRPDGLSRALFFADGSFLGADTSEADGGHEVSAVREGDLFKIRVNDERYEIPEALLQEG